MLLQETKDKIKQYFQCLDYIEGEYYLKQIDEEDIKLDLNIRKDSDFDGFVYNIDANKKPDLILIKILSNLNLAQLITRVGAYFDNPYIYKDKDVKDMLSYAIKVYNFIQEVKNEQK